MANPRKFQIGDRFGKLEVVGTEVGLGPESNRLWAVCRCDCGNEVKIVSHALRRRTSCGCGKLERVRAMHKAKVLPDKLAARRSLYATYRISAGQRGYAFDLTLDEFSDLISQPCWYCGDPPELKIRSSNVGGNIHAHGIDRQDPKIGYVPDNCVPCCKHCNYAKRSLTAEEFIKQAIKVADYARFHPSRPGR